MNDGYSVLFDLIGLLARRRHQMGEQGFSTLGLNHTEARVLSLLSAAGGETTQDGLSNQLFIDRSNAGRALQRLETDGYVVRRTGTANRRTKSVELTEKGHRAATEIGRLREEMARTFFGTLSERQAGEIAAMLKDVIDLSPKAGMPTASGEGA